MDLTDYDVFINVPNLDKYYYVHNNSPFLLLL